MSRRHTIVSRRDVDAPAMRALVGRMYRGRRVIGVEVQRDQWIALVEDGEQIEFVPCEVVARCINDTDGAELPDAAKQGRFV